MRDARGYGLGGGNAPSGRLLTAWDPKAPGH